MDFINHSKGNGGYFLLMDQDTEIGKLTYTIFPDDQKMIISFVNVYPQFEGKGNGKLLVLEAIAYARKHKLNIYPHCSYARSVMLRMSDVNDVLIK